MSAKPSVGERLAAALLPVLLHRINNTTQLLMAVRSLAALEPLALPPRSSADLAVASEAAQQHGWLLGVLAQALGTDLLLAREERDGLRSTLVLVREGLQRIGRSLVFAADETPRLGLARGVPSTAQRCAAFAALVREAGVAAEASRPMALLFARGAQHHELRGDAGAGAELRRAFDELGLERLGCALSEESGAWTLHVPAAWLSFED